MPAMTFNGNKVQVRTLTVAEIHRLVRDAEQKKKADIIEILFDDPVPTEALLLATGLEMDDLVAESVLPQQIKALLDEVRRKNPFFAAMMDRAVAAVAEKPPASSVPSAS